MGKVITGLDLQALKESAQQWAARNPGNDAVLERVWTAANYLQSFLTLLKGETTPEMREFLVYQQAYTEIYGETPDVKT